MTPCLLADFTVFDVKLIVAHRAMVDSPCLHVAVHKSIAKWACVNNRFLCHNTVFHLESVPAYPAMIYLPCAYVAEH